MMSQTSLLNGGAAFILLALLISVFCQVTDHQMLIENCNWPRNLTVSLTGWPRTTLESPSTGNHNLASNFVCQTQVTSLYNYNLKLRVLKFDLRGSNDCRPNSERVILQISGYPNITWCGTTYPEEMILPREPVNVTYNTGMFGVGTGFKMEFSAVLIINSYYQRRNWIVATQPKLLYSPNYPGSYRSNHNCTVFLDAENGQYIYIQSLVFSIVYSVDCQYDALTINKVKYCGSNPIDVVVDSSVAQIEFSSDNFMGYSGFVLKYAAFKPDIQAITCRPKQLYITENIQFATTPNYPNKFVNMNCEWTIQNIFSYAGKSNIVLEFPDLSNFDCLDSEVQILTQSGGGDFYLNNSLCKQRSFNTTIMQGQVKIRLISVATYMEQGFSFAYYIETVGNEVTLYAGADDNYLTSPNYPKNYPNDADYTWHITTTYYSSVIVVELVDFSLEKENQVQRDLDFVKVYDGPTKSSPLIKAFYGMVSYTKFSSTGSDMTIVFHSDTQNSDRGFSFKYRSQKIADSGDCCQADYSVVIVGAVTGGIVCLVVIVGVTVFIMKRRKWLRANTSNTVSGRPAGIGVPVTRGNRSVFIMSPATMNVNLAPPSYLTVQNTHPGTEPPPYSSLQHNTDHVLPAYTPRLNDFENPAYGVHDLPPPYSSDMLGGTAQQVSRVIHIVYSRQGSSADNIEDRTTSGAGADISLGVSPGVRDEVVGDHVISENIYNEITPSGDHVMAIASAPSEIELPPLTQHPSHVDINTPREAPPAYENRSFLQDNGQQRILPHKKNDNLGSL